MAVDVEPLLQRLSALAPQFGRAQADIEAMVTRGRAADFKGVMQNARLVLETLLRSLVIDELKQTPGKAMLDELVTKFRQQANVGIIPTNVLAHMGTVQAWGNLSAHDHAGSLSDSGVTVGRDEVVASLNSMVAILSWYAQKRGLGAPATSGAEPVAASSSPEVASPRRSRAPFVAGGLAVLGLVGFGVMQLTSRAAPPRFDALDALYLAWKEPPPPPACRRAEDVEALVRNANDVHALSLLESPSPEAAYLLARATKASRGQRAASLDVALSCPGFAAAHALEADFALEANDLTSARRSLEAARAAAPKSLAPRAKLAGLLLQTGALAEAASEIDALIAADAEYAPAYLLRFSLLTLQGHPDLAAVELCRAVRLGSQAAREKAKQAELRCEGVR